MKMRHYGNESTTMFYLNDEAKCGKSHIRVLIVVSGDDGMQGAYGAVEYDNAVPQCVQ